MQIQVNVNNLTLIQSDELNENEYNIHKIQFTFSDEYSGGLAKVALFTGNSGTYKVIITNNECNIPAEILANKDCFTLGVYAFDVENDELIERFSPSPIKLYILDGSYIPDEETENSEPITPTDKEQILAELAKLEIDAEQIAINKQDIADIKQEQIEQNSAIQTNAEEIEQVRSGIPTKTSQLTNDSNYVNQTQMTNAIAEETTARQNADINLQEQIDAITVSSDVIDVLGTYQDLQNYDTQHVKANDVIKVLQDSTHDNAMSYYRWVITGNVGSWQYVGSEGPYYTKSEIDGKVQEINNDIAGLSDDIDTIEGTIEEIQEDIGNIETEQTEQNTRITELEQEIEDLQNNQLTGTAQGTSIDLTDSADSRVRSIELKGNSTQETTEGKNLLDSYVNNQTVNGITVSYDVTTQIITLNGTATAYTQIGMPNWAGVSVPANTTLYGLIKYISGSSTGQLAFYFYNSNYSSNLNIIAPNGVSQDVTNSVKPTYDVNYTVKTNVMRINADATFNNLKIKVMVSKVDTNYEPYTGGIASPNPSYPQEIYSAGDNINKFNKNAVTEGYYIASDGTETANNSWCISNYMEVSKVISYQGLTQTGTAPYSAWYDSNKNFISSFKQAYHGTKDVPSNAKYVRFSVNISSSYNDLNTFKVEEGSVETPYSPYGMGCITEKIINKNLWKLANDNVLSGYIDRYTNKIVSYATNRVIFLPIKGGKTYTVSKNAGSKNLKLLGYSNDEKPRINLVLTDVYYNSTGSQALTTTAPANAKWLCVTAYGDTDSSYNVDDVLNSIQIEEGDTMTSYVAHAEQNFIIPCQQPMRDKGTVKDLFVKIAGNWFERHYIGNYIFTGNETISITNTGGTNWFYAISIPSVLMNGDGVASNSRCTHYKAARIATSSTEEGYYFVSDTKTMRIRFGTEDTVANYKAWMANNNVQFEYISKNYTDLPCTSEQTTVLEAYIKARTYKNVTHFYSEDETPAYQEVVYVKDLETVINNLGGA